MSRIAKAGLIGIVSVTAACVGKAPLDSRRVEASPGVYSVAEANNAKRVVDVIGHREVKCKRRRPVGTNLTRTTCQTEAEQKLLRENDQDEFRKYQIRTGGFVPPDLPVEMGPQGRGGR